jgi:hypothetical protein
MKLVFFIHCNSRTGGSASSDPQKYSIPLKKIVGVLLFLEVVWNLSSKTSQIIEENNYKFPQLVLQWQQKQ